MKTNKIQYLLINHLQKHGAIKLILPDGVILEIGINQLDQCGGLKKVDNYCWVIVTREDKVAVLDSYNLGIRYKEGNDAILFEEKQIANEGEVLHYVDVV